jgi:hypothetical protein
MRTEKLVAMVGTADKKNGGLINSYAKVFANTKAELKTKLKEMYKDTFWQQVPDDIAVYPIVTESNGYQHCGEEMFRVTSKRFWAKK